MKKIFSFIIVLMISLVPGFSQNVGINADGTAPDSSAMLDVKSNNKGFLLPRMTMALRDGISRPAEGLMVFCTDCGVNGAVSVYSNSQWRSYQDCITPTPVAGTHVATLNSVQWTWTSASTTMLGYKFSSTNNYATAVDLGNVLSKTDTGMECGTSYTRYLWGYTGCGISTPLTLTQTTLNTIAAPDTSKGPNTDTQITWKWKAVPGATGYKWSTTPGVFANAIDVGTALTYTETGLTPLTSQQAYVWAYTNCGYSSPAYLYHFTQAGGCTVATVDYEGITYHTLKMGAQCWLKENLNVGTRVDNSANQTNNSIAEKYCYNNDEANCTTYGGLYQWAEIVQYLNGTTNIANWNPVPSGNVQGLCPSGWHIPSDAEYVTLKSTITNIVAASMGSNMEGLCMRENSGNGHWTTPSNPVYDGNNYVGFTALGSGYRNTTSPAYWSNFNTYSFFWTITCGANWASVDGFNNTNPYFQVSGGSGNKAYGYPVRCLKD